MPERAWGFKSPLRHDFALALFSQSKGSCTTHRPTLLMIRIRVRSVRACAPVAGRVGVFNNRFRGCLQSWHEAADLRHREVAQAHQSGWGGAHG